MLENPFKTELLRYVTGSGAPIPSFRPGRRTLARLRARQSFSTAEANMPRRRLKSKPRYLSPYARRKVSRLQAGQIALREIRRMQREQEMKYIYSAAEVCQVAIGGAATVDGFGPYCAQGDGVSNRVGNRITMKSLSIRFNVKLGALEADGTSLRILVVLDRRPAGANAAITDMLMADDILAPYRTTENVRGRFQFLMDVNMDFSAQEGERSGKFFYDRDTKIEYYGNVGTVADVTRGNLMVVGISRGNAAAIDIDYAFMLKFTDD